jgi:transglutaminase-like putative cysteine protease
VSGYLRTIPPEGQERLQGADASHAWVSVFCPVNGWVDFDPTNDVMPSDGHVRVAVGRDFSDVSPLNGVLTGGGEHVVRVEVDVIPVGA